MGGHQYSSSNREISGRTEFYASAPVNQIFKQNIKRRIHKEMDPHDIDIREARDSDIHPNTVPIILGLDLTGSMGHVPHQLIKDGLPTLIGGIIQNGVSDPVLLFLGVGDHECDGAPLQAGQFESGDEQLDMWLTRTYLEGGGGGNGGESYLFAWHFAAIHTIHDAWEKRKKKGFLITIGDEPCLEYLPADAIQKFTGKGQNDFTMLELLDKARERYHVYHIHLDHHGGNYMGSEEQWKQILGGNCIVTPDYTEIPNIIKSIIVDGSEKTNVVPGATGENADKPKEESVNKPEETEIL